jgi:predicted deacetylase
MSRALCVVVHDVADRTLPLCRRLVAEIDAVATVPLTFLAVPRYHGDAPSRALEGWLDERASEGHELALHGFTHRDDAPLRGAADRLLRRVYTRGEGEFEALDVAEARARLQAGLRWFARNGWPVAGFVAPAWLLGPAAWEALREARTLRYTATLRYLHLLDEARRVRAQSLVYSTERAWRRAASRAWVALNARTQSRAPLLRLELHPGDVRDAAIRRSWQRVLAEAADRREAMTVAGFVDGLAAAVRAPPASMDAEAERGREGPDRGAHDHVTDEVQAEDDA